MVNFYPAFIDDRWRSAWNTLAPERDLEHARLQQACEERGLPVTHALANAIDKSFAARIPRPPLSALIDHIDHICRIAGHAHVGLGSDYDGICALPEGLDSAADLPKIAEALAHRGYTEQQLRGVLGSNLLRVMRLVEQAASHRTLMQPYPPPWKTAISTGHQRGHNALCNVSHPNKPSSRPEPYGRVVRRSGEIPALRRCFCFSTFTLEQCSHQ